MWIVLHDSMDNEDAPDIEMFTTEKAAVGCILDMYDLYARTVKDPMPLSITNQTPGVTCYLYNDADEWCYLYHDLEATE